MQREDGKVIYKRLTINFLTETVAEKNTIPMIMGLTSSDNRFTVKVNVFNGQLVDDGEGDIRTIGQFTVMDIDKNDDVKVRIIPKNDNAKHYMKQSNNGLLSNKEKPIVGLINDGRAYTAQFYAANIFEEADGQELEFLLALSDGVTSIVDKSEITYKMFIKLEIHHKRQADENSVDPDAPAENEADPNAETTDEAAADETAGATEEGKENNDQGEDNLGPDNNIDQSKAQGTRKPEVSLERDEIEGEIEPPEKTTEEMEKEQLDMVSAVADAIASKPTLDTKDVEAISTTLTATVSALAVQTEEGL